MESRRLYTQAIEKIVYWLKKAEGVAEDEAQKAAIGKLIEYYETGDLKTFDEYAILWVKDLNSRIDLRMDLLKPMAIRSG